MSMVRVVRVELTYVVKGDNEAAFKEGVEALTHAFDRLQGRTESISSCGRNGSSEAICASPKANVTVEGQ
jgi:hypothetical protein